MLGDKNKVARKGLTEKVTFKQRPEGSDPRVEGVICKMGRSTKKEVSI